MLLFVLLVAVAVLSVVVAFLTAEIRTHSEIMLLAFGIKRFKQLRKLATAKELPSRELREAYDSIRGQDKPPPTPSPTSPTPRECNCWNCQAKRKETAHQNA